MKEPRFYKGRWDRKMTGVESWKKWKADIGHKATYSEWSRSWKAIRQEIYKTITENPVGIDLPFFMGNISVKILDSEFKCAKDFFTTKFRNSPDEPIRRMPYTKDIALPRRAKFVWKKHPLFMGLAATMGIEFSKGFKKYTVPKIHENINIYQKAQKYKRKKTLCEDEPEKSIFD